MTPAQRTSSWRSQDFLVLDFETTTANPRRAQPLSAGWVCISGGRVVMASAHYTLVQYRGEVPLATMRIHRLLPDELHTAPSAEQLANQLHAQLQGKILVAHNAALELAVLRKLRMRIHRSQVIDTMQLSRHERRREDRRAGIDFGLTAAARWVGVPAWRPHHAFGDALTTALLLLALAGRREQRGEATTESLLRVSRQHYTALFNP